MKILFLITSLHNGGAQRALSNLSQNFPDEIECTVLLNKRYLDDYSFKGEIITLGVEEDFKMNPIYQWKVLCQRLKVLRNLKSSGEYQACISFMDSSNFANILSGNKRCKVIISVRISYDGIVEKIYKYFIVPVAKILYRFADGVVAVSRAVGNELSNDMHIDTGKIHIICNAFNIREILNNAQKKIENPDLMEFVKDSFVYVNMGRLELQKGQLHLIRAFSSVRMQCEDAKLIIMGNGEEWEYLWRIIRLYDLENYVKILPFQSNPYQILAVCHVYVFPSLWEGYSNALCEALICGLPCVASDCKTGNREILAPGTDITYQNLNEIEYAEYGLLTPVCSGKRYVEVEELEKAEKLLAEAMMQLQSDHVLYERYKRAVQERAKQLDIRYAMHKWMDLLKNV